MSARKITASLAGVVAVLFLAAPAGACCKAQFEPTKPHVNLGTIGHKGHRKGGSGAGQATGTGSSLQQPGPSAPDRRSLMILVTPKIVPPQN